MKKMLKLLRCAQGGRGLGAACYSELAQSHTMKFQKDKLPPKFVDLLPASKYGNQSFVTLLLDTSVEGQWCAEFIRKLFSSAQVPVLFERLVATSEEHSSEEVLLSVKRNRNALQVYLPHEPEQKQVCFELNNELDLFACVIKLQSCEGFKCKFSDVHMTLITQNNTGDYRKLEYQPVKGLVHTLRVCDDETTQRYMRFVFNYARLNGHTKVTVTHKIKELPLTDGRFLQIARDVHEREFGDVRMELMSIDELVLGLVMQPHKFDVICTSDRYGTIIAAIASAVCGGADLFSANEIGEHHAVFKPLLAKLSIPENRELSPYGLMRSCIDLLDHLGNWQCAMALDEQLISTMMDDQLRTREYGGTDSGDLVVENIVNSIKCRYRI